MWYETRYSVYQQQKKHPRLTFPSLRVEGPSLHNQVQCYFFFFFQLLAYQQIQDIQRTVAFSTF